VDDLVPHLAHRLDEGNEASVNGEINSKPLAIFQPQAIELTQMVHLLVSLGPRAERFGRVGHVSEGVRQARRKSHECHVPQEPLLANVRKQNIAVLIFEILMMFGVRSLIHRGFYLRQLRLTLFVQILLARVQCSFDEEVNVPLELVVLVVVGVDVEQGTVHFPTV